ncbi:MAG: TIR domain-containing protein [Chloroflexota bacterium]
MKATYGRSILLFAAYAIAVWVTAYQGMHGDDASGLVSVILLFSGACVLVYVAFLRRIVTLGVYAPAVAIILGLLGLAFGTVSAGEGQVGIIAGLAAGGVAAAVSTVVAKRRRRQTKTIFLSYRRADSGDIIEPIAAKLAARFGEENIFRDVVSIELGARFRDVITDAVNHSDALIAVIGERWLSLTNESGQRRLDLPDDLVRIEIETALNNAKVLVIPLAVSGARIPNASDLPQSIRDLAMRNGGVVGNAAQFAGDMARLINGLDRGSITPWSRAASDRFNWRRAAAAIVVLLLPLAGLLLEELARDYRTINAATLSPDQSMIATAHGVGIGVRSRVRIWDTNSGRILHELEAGDDPIWDVTWSPTGAYLAYGNHRGRITVVSTRDWRMLSTLTDHAGILKQIAWTSDDTRVASGDDTGTVHAWNIKTSEHIAAPVHSGNITRVQWSPAGDRLASASWDYTVAIIDAATGKLVHRIEGHRSFVNTVAWSSDGSMVATGSLEKPYLMLWDVRKPNRVVQLQGHSRPVEVVAWAPTRPLLASASDESVRIWDASGTIVRALGSGNGTPDIAWSPDGRLLAVTDDESVTVWDAATWNRLSGWQAHPKNWGVRIVGWWPDASRLATRGSSDETVRVWNVTDGRLLATIGVGVVQSLHDRFL